MGRRLELAKSTRNKKKTLGKLCPPSLHLGTPFRTAVCCILCTTWGDLCVIKGVLVHLYGGVDRVDFGFGHSLFRSTTDLFSWYTWKHVTVCHLPEDVRFKQIVAIVWASRKGPHANAEDWFVNYDVKIIPSKKSPCMLPFSGLIQNKRTHGNRQLPNLLRGLMKKIRRTWKRFFWKTSFLFPMESTENVEESKEERKSRCLDVLG